MDCALWHKAQFVLVEAMTVQGVVMGDNNGSRNSSREVLVAGDGVCRDADGVGGRQGQAHPPARGGGSPDNCTKIEFTIGGQKKIGADPRLDELRDMGMRPRWLYLAEQIGVDAFLTMWRLLDENPPNMPGSTVYVSMPRFTRFLRYQRNRFIESLVQEGLQAPEIQRRVKRDLCEDISVRHIDRISEKLRKIGKIDQ